MQKNLSYCGLICTTCPIYLATTLKNDEKRHKMRIDIARQIEEHYGEAFKPEDVTDCDGCKAKSGRLFSGSGKCKIRKCAKKKDIENCAYCDEYSCQKLEELFAMDPQARKRLDKIRSKL